MTESTDSEIIRTTEEELFCLLTKDEYFGSGPIEVNHVQTKGHLNSTREHCLLLPTIESVDRTFEDHSAALNKLDSIAKSVLQTASDFSANQKALAKARADEQKAT